MGQPFQQLRFNYIIKYSNTLLTRQLPKISLHSSETDDTHVHASEYFFFYPNGTFAILMVLSLPSHGTFSTLNVIRLLIHRNIQGEILTLTSTLKKPWIEIGSGLIISILGKLNLFNLINVLDEKSPFCDCLSF